MLSLGPRVTPRPIWTFALVLASALQVAACDGESDPVGTDNPELPLQPRFPIDGVANLDPLPIVFDGEVGWQGDGAPADGTTMRIAVQNDDVDLYVAVEWTDPTFNDHPGEADAVRVQFDSNGDGQVGSGDDVRTVYSAHGGSLYLDRHWDGSTGDAYDAGTAKDPTGDGMGRLTYDAATQRYTVEFLLPLGDDAQGDDGIKSATTRFSVATYDGAGGGRVALPFGENGDGAPTGAWPALELRDVGLIDRPGRPTNLSGLVAFLSDHEGRRGLYMFRPRSGEQWSIPVDPALHIEHISLSNDRNWIALEASYTPEDSTTFEIFRVASDGSRLKQLTDNAVFDGSPAWSRSGHRIVYHSERDGGPEGRRHASIVLMTPDGVEVDDLSVDTVDEREPAYLDDGRIVIKTTRASPWPRYRIAAIRESGASFDILTEGLGGTDHRPQAKDPWIYYERFRGEGHFGADPDPRTKPWDILSVHTLGGQGSTLVSDGWANRSPVPDPTGAYVAYLRQSGHTSVELVGWTGTYLGRLIPDVTDIIQFDWK